MNPTEKSLVLKFSMKRLIDLFFMISLLSLLSIPLVLAREAQAPATVKNQMQPGVPVVATPETEKAMTQTLETYSSANSVDFLMEEPPLTQNTTMDTALQVMTPPSPAANTISPSPVSLQVLQGMVVEEADDVAMLVAEQCSQNGSASEGSSSCERVYSNNHRTTVLTQNANEGDESKTQTVIEEFDGDNTLLFRKTLRHRVDYNYLKGQKTKEKELFDIIYQPAGGKATRELIAYEFFLDTGKARSLAWTQYQQTTDKPKAELVYYALLRYGNDGSPDRGLAERWDQGKKTESFMDWSRQSKGFATLDEESWKQWEGWIRNVSLQAYLP